MEELIVLGDEEKVKEKIAVIEIEPTLNEYNEIVYAVRLKVYPDDCGFVPEQIRCEHNILNEVFSSRWGWREYDESMKKECRMRAEIFRTREEAEKAAREIVKVLKQNYEEYLKKKKKCQIERKVIHIYL